MIEPETKDLTWVLTRRCDQCGTDAATFTPADVPVELAAAADGWDRVLHRPRVDLRPDDSTWSPLEYGAHVRDVHRLFGDRVRLVLSADDPVFANWDQDETAVAARYAEADPERTADELEAAAQRFVDRLRSVTGEQWQRPGRRSDGDDRTLRSRSDDVQRGSAARPAPRR